ncbi:hypothetical protein ACHAWF_005167, partial [Thalassiosira exigua]
GQSDVAGRAKPATGLGASIQSSIQSALEERTEATNPIRRKKVWPAQTSAGNKDKGGPRAANGARRKKKTNAQAGSVKPNGSKEDARAQMRKKIPEQTATSKNKAPREKVLPQSSGRQKKGEKLSALRNGQEPKGMGRTGQRAKPGAQTQTGTPALKSHTMQQLTAMNEVGGEYPLSFEQRKREKDKESSAEEVKADGKVPRKPNKRNKTPIPTYYPTTYYPTISSGQGQSNQQKQQDDDRNQNDQYQDDQYDDRYQDDQQDDQYQDDQQDDQYQDDQQDDQYQPPGGGYKPPGGGYKPPGGGGYKPPGGNWNQWNQWNDDPYPDNWGQDYQNGWGQAGGWGWWSSSGKSGKGKGKGNGGWGKSSKSKSSKDSWWKPAYTPPYGPPPYGGWNPPPYGGPYDSDMPTPFPTWNDDGWTGGNGWDGGKMDGGWGGAPDWWGGGPPWSGSASKKGTSTDWWDGGSWGWSGSKSGKASSWDKPD